MNHLPYSLSDRTAAFSKKVLLFCGSVQATIVTRPIIDQLIRSANSVGANYAEANNAASKTDFRNKIFIAKKEAAESEYWLILLEDFAPNKADCIELKQECHYILMTLQKIINTLRDNTENGKQKTQSERKTVNGERH
ncbi:MAG: four helix bundle protein [Patescibacteria group bacterium]